MSKPKSNKMGVVQLTILTMVNMMGSGIIMLPTKLSEVGTISIISWLVTAVRLDGTGLGVCEMRYV
ncbi:putrescine-ornithine antiporter [Salmonella enterica subsp. enterica]|nr:putrescine-ornithine antiporter [Salmonella enterica subsp. enterica]